MPDEMSPLIYTETNPQVKLLLEEAAKKRKEEEAASHLLKVMTMNQKDRVAIILKLTREGLFALEGERLFSFSFFFRTH